MKLLVGNSVVFLIGATGFLGSQTIRQLLALASVSKVIVLVRARDASASFERIVAAGTTVRWWSPALSSRIEVWPGDLARPRLGVSMDQWACLEGTCVKEPEAITALMHNGAVVNWSSSYERLRATNVLRTVQAAAVATISTRVSGKVMVHKLWTASKIRKSGTRLCKRCAKAWSIFSSLRFLQGETV